MAILYRGSSNNGVFTVLSETAYRELEAFNEVAGRESPEFAWATMPYPVEVATFTFADRMAGQDGDWITGSLEELDAWLKGHEVRVSDFGNYVPFSNGYGMYPNDAKYRLTPRQVIQMFELHR